MRTALFLAGMILSLAAQPQEIYRWVDKDGIVHYEDQPGAPDAKRVELVGLSTYEAEAVSAESGEPEPPPREGDQAEVLDEGTGKLAQRCPGVHEGLDENRPGAVHTGELHGNSEHAHTRSERASRP